jgi:hypothetical protein
MVATIVAALATSGPALARTANAVTPRPAGAAAGATVMDTRQFVGTGRSIRPPEALTRAANQAVFKAAGAGYGHCVPVNEDLYVLDDEGLYEAKVTRECELL